MNDTETVNTNVLCEKIPRGLAVICAVAMAAAPMLSAPCAQDRIFSAETAASGRREHIVQVNQWGRYSVEVKSAEGTAIEIADKLRGAFARGGTIGAEDGRINVFLEAGSYKIFTEGPRDAKGILNLTVTGFSFDNKPVNISADSSINSPAALPAGRPTGSRTDKKKGARNKPAQPPPDTVGSAARIERNNDYEYLKPFEQTAAELGDMDARGWWIFVPQDTLVYIEAMGRRLGTLAVFRNGEMLTAHIEKNKEGDEPESNSIMSDFVNASLPEKPLNGLRIVKRLERGKHLVVAYGGGEDRYAVSDSASPLYVQWMLEPLTLSRHLDAKINASGANSYAIPVWADYIAIESPEKEKPLIEYHAVNGAAVFSRDTVHRGHADPMTVIKITRKWEGEKWEGEWTDRRTDRLVMLFVSGKPGSRFKITPINSAFSQQQIGPKEDGTFQLSTLHTGSAEDNIGASGVLIDLKDTSIAALQADTITPARPLHRQFNLLSEITSYLWVGETGTYTFMPAGEADYEWRIKRFFVKEPRDYNAPRRTMGALEITLSKGLHIIEIYPVKKGRAAFLITGKQAVKDISEVKAANPRQSVIFKPLNLKAVSNTGYRFFLNSQLPELSSTYIDTYPVSGEDKFIILTGEAAEREEANASRVSELEPGIQQYTNMNKNGSRAYQFTVSEAGVYRMETLGRLQTALTLRDRFNGFTRTQSGGGAGRNALITEYLLPGRYLLITECEKESAGRMGIILNKGEMLAGGRLQDGIDKRAAVKAHGAAVYDFTANQDGRFSFESFNDAGPIPARIEDSDGWPLEISDDWYGLETREVDLKKGAYKIYSLPLTYETYRVTRVQRIEEKPPQFSGYGPHVIRINEPVSARWVTAVRASDSGEDTALRRTPARFMFETPAQMEAKILLSPDFQGILKPQGKDTALLKINGIHHYVKLDRGKYEIAVSPVKETNHAPYELSVTTTDLLAGINYDIDTLRDMRVQIGESGVYEIFSQGKRELSARLYKEDGKTEVTRSGGDPQDWNFVISERLEPGRYFLRFITAEPKTSSTEMWRAKDSPTRIFMRRVEDTLMQTIKLTGPDAVSKKISAAGKLAVIPVECSFGDILVLKAKSDTRVICELEASQKSNTAITGRQQGKQIKMSAPIDRKNKYTLKIWSEDRTNNDITLEIKTVEALPLTYEKALNAVTGTASEENGNTVFYRISGMPAGPGHYELITTQNDISRASGVNGTAQIFLEEDGSLLPSAGKQLWIEAAFQSAGHYRFVISPVLITDVKELAEKNKRKFETSDKYRFSKNRIKYLEREELPVRILPNKEKIFEIDTPMQKLGLATFSLVSGRPLAGLSASEQNADFIRNGMPVLGGQYLEDNACLTAVIPGDTGRIIGWNALAGGPPDGSSGSFMMKSCTLEKADTLKTGRTAWKADSTQAKEYIIPANRSQTVTVKLSPRAGLLYIQRDGRRNMYYGGENGARHTIESDGGKLFLFGNTESGGTGNVELEAYASLPSGESAGQPQELSAGAETVRQFSVDTKEIIRVKNDAAAYRRLFASGAVESMEWLSRSGWITSNIKGEAKLSGESGMLIVNYAPGWGKLRLCKDDGSQLALNECRWGGAVKKEGAPIIKEASRVTMADEVNWYSIELSEPAHISLSAPIPAAAIISVDGKARDYEEFWEELSWDIPLAPGKFTAAIKPLAGRASAGIPLTIGFYPIPLLTENKPLDMYLMAGQKRIAKFVLPRKSKIGVGVSMNAETAEAVLMDRMGKNISKGKQIFTELESGTYYILLSATSASNGTGVKLYLFGQNNQPANPPKDLVRWIIGGGAGKRPTGAPAALDMDDLSSDE